MANASWIDRVTEQWLIDTKTLVLIHIFELKVPINSASSVSLYLARWLEQGALTTCSLVDLLAHGQGVSTVSYVPATLTRVEYPLHTVHFTDLLHVPFPKQSSSAL